MYLQMYKSLLNLELPARTGGHRQKKVLSTRLSPNRTSVQMQRKYNIFRGNFAPDVILFEWFFLRTSLVIGCP